ncbi:unnamed protein product [Schistosoma margrebowiei]|uniref:Uncharacterized protein n=1 Tax=Schistosoma margrebowiei TaxID=48269 RepID=A0A183N588_9TREM|nr:unnamed protein product [Schistosoma margrebowiei]
MSETSFSHFGQQHVSSVPSTADASDHSPFGIVDFSQSWPDHPRSCQRTQLIFWSRICLALVCYGRFWFLGSTRFRPTPAAFSGRDPYERNPGYKSLWCGMLTRATNTAHVSWYRSS